MNHDMKVRVVLQALVQGIVPGVALLVPLAAATGLGFVLLSLRRPAGERSPVEFPLAIVLGLGVAGYVSDLVYMFQIVPARRVLFLEIAVGLTCLALSWRHLGPLVAPRRSWEWEGTTRADRALAMLGWCVVLLVLVKHYIKTVTPVSDNDSIVQYAFLSRLIANNVGFDQMLVLHKIPLVDLNRLVEHVYALGYVVMGEGSMHLMNFTFFGVTLLLLHRFCVDYLKVLPFWNPLPILIALNTLEILATGYTAKLDYAVAMFEVAAMIVVVVRRRVPFWLVPAFLGLAACARVNAIRIVPVAGLVLCADLAWSEGSRIRLPVLMRALKTTALVVLAAGLVAAPPYAFQWMIFGNPFFPFFNGVFGAYSHWYDYTLFSYMRYRVSGIAGPFLLYVQLCTIRFWQFLQSPAFLGGRYALGPVFLLVPFTLTRRRPVVLLYALYVLGFWSWYFSAHTHRTLLGVAFIGVPLLVDLFSRLRRVPAVYTTLSLGVMSLAFLTLYAPVEASYLDYFTGRIGADEFYEREVRVENPLLRTPDIQDVVAIRSVVKDDIVMSVNVVLHAHQDLLKVLLVEVPESSMASRIEAGNLPDLDRIIVGQTFSNVYLQRRFAAFATQVFPEAGGALPVLAGRRAVWDFVRTYYDVGYFVGDELLRTPGLIVNLMQIQNARYLVTPPDDRNGAYRAVRGLHLLRSSPDIDFFEYVGRRP